ncbi:hypothetical protein EC973_000150 [Apophysomyces ossiformis]|uniref:DUF1264-domain-containing protein n=1 Tax=Apophysomyces ossiformis TaxID=679940 RepID=A0A8H7BZW2_9FUNG|nr:hypothetical protein EC973_000150 [Apophysomyces ossiformis]
MADVPGEPLTTQSKAAGATTATVQPFDQLSGIKEHICGFHFYAHDATRFVHAHHLCSHVNEDFRQCVIYDSARANARLIGIEYIISEKLFAALDDEEKKYWHSHDFEVRSGVLAAVAPKLMPEAGVRPIERQAMMSLQKTYGKTWHTWQVDRHDSLPLGPAQLMMAMTDESQIDPAIVKKREQEEGINVDVKREERKDMEPYAPLPGADAWTVGQTIQVVPERMNMKRSVAA